MSIAQMSIAEMLLPEFEQEMASTRRALERAPDDKFDWKAHPKSNTLGWLVSHLVEIPGWTEGILTQEVWEMHPEGGEMYQTPQLTSREQVLAEFDKNVAAGKQALSKASDEQFAVKWSLHMKGEPLYTGSRYETIRMWVLNHTVHHRAFLCAYLRLNNLPVPGMYGPSGDE